MNIMRTRATYVAAELDGTAAALTDVATLAEADNIDFCRALDTLVLQCGCCGWWVPTDEASTDTGDVLCAECSEENAE